MRIEKKRGLLKQPAEKTITLYLSQKMFQELGNKLAESFDTKLTK